MGASRRGRERGEIELPSSPEPGGPIILTPLTLRRNARLELNVKQYSHTLFWLLVAATLAVDAVAVVWLLENQLAHRAEVLYDALCFSQLSVACIWAVFAPHRRIWSLAVLVVGLLVATAATAKLFDFPIPEMIAFFGAYATLLVILLWVMKHTSIWPYRAVNDPPVWQFSFGQLLAFVTVAAVLLGLSRGSELWGIGDSVAIELIATCLTTIVIVVVWAKSWRWPTRLAWICSLAVAIGITSWGYDWWRADPLLGVQTDDLPMYVVNGLIQAGVIFLWLEVGRIIPAAESSVDGYPPMR